MTYSSSRRPKHALLMSLPIVSILTHSTPASAASGRWIEAKGASCPLRCSVPEPNPAFPNAVITGKYRDGEPLSVCRVRWSRLFGQLFRFDEWSLCRG
jgi:hypothetical protein